MKRKYGLRNIKLFLSICVSVFSACFCVVLMAGEYYTARNKLDIYNNEFQGWEACRQTEPNYYEANVEAVSSCLNNMEEAKDDFWIKLSKAKIIVLFVLAGLVSAIGGYLAFWAAWFAGLGIRRFVRWIKLFYQNKILCIGSQDEDEEIVKEVEELEYHIEKTVDANEKINEEELEHQLETLREEVCSVRSDIEKLSTIEDCKYDIPKDESGI